MAQITAITRCAGLNHVHFTVNTSLGSKTVMVIQSDLDLAAKLSDDEYVRQRLSLLVREARGRGAVSFAQIRTDLIGREFVE